jgi:hypothetical protein
MKAVYAVSTRLLSVILIVLGIAMVASTIARGGGGLAIGVVLGTSLMLLGAGRLWLASGGGSR